LVAQAYQQVALRLQKSLEYFRYGWNLPGVHVSVDNDGMLVLQDLVGAFSLVYAHAGLTIINAAAGWAAIGLLYGS
jgi:hypothetical protein